MLSATGPAGAASALDEVTCTFFDDYVASGFEASAGMPLAIAIAGDELPTAVLDVFARIEDGEQTGIDGAEAIVGYFTPICDGSLPGGSASGAAPDSDRPAETFPDGTESGQDGTWGSKEDTHASEESTHASEQSTVPPDLLASTGATSATWILFAFACLLLAAGAWALQLDRLRLAIVGAVPKRQPRGCSSRSELRATCPPDPATRSVGAKAPRHTFWLLDDSGD